MKYLISINSTHFIKDNSSAHVTLDISEKAYFPEITDSINSIAPYAQVLYLVYDKKPLNTAPNR